VGSFITDSNIPDSFFAVLHLFYTMSRRTEIRFPTGANVFLNASGPTLRLIQYPIRWVPVNRLPAVKRSGCEADPSRLSIGEVKNAWNYTSVIRTPPYPCAF